MCNLCIKINRFILFEFLLNHKSEEKVNSCSQQICRYHHWSFLSFILRIHFLQIVWWSLQEHMNVNHRYLKFIFNWRWCTEYIKSTINIWKYIYKFAFTYMCYKVLDLTCWKLLLKIHFHLKYKKKPNGNSY